MQPLESFSKWVRLGSYGVALTFLLAMITGCGGGSSSADKDALAAPANVQAVAGNTQITVQWSEVAAATGYNVYRSSTPGIHPNTAVSYDFMAENVASPYVVSSLTNGAFQYFVVTATADGEESAASAEVSAMPTGGLNDTGITRCGNYAFTPQGTGGNHSNSLDCEATGATADVAGVDASGNPVPPRQDAHVGRDADPGLVKVGAGAAGFDRTRLGADGQPLAIQDGVWDEGGSEAAGTRWSCVRDNHTGLIWEIKVDDPAHLHHVGHWYTWYNPDANANGGSAGVQDGGTCAGSDCDTHGFVEAVNVAGLCGANDWRMPTRQELMSILDNGRSFPAFDSDSFPNLANNIFVWSSTPAAWNPDHAWRIGVGSGRVQIGSKASGTYLRLVRTGH